jgi:phosphoribosylamine--glycine ligase
MNFDSLAEFATRNECFTVVGPEEPLAKGIVNFFRSKGLETYGVSREAAIAEASKAWAKLFMKQHDIPTAEFQIFRDPEAAMDYVKKKGAPIVVKADGLAAGKGAAVCSTEEMALRAIDEIMIQKKFGSSGEQIVVEEFLVGEEASYMAIVDTETREYVPLASSQDHKPIFDGDRGPNTGGMGAYSPAPVITNELEETIRRNIIERFIDGMREAKIEYKGTLYLGLMIVEGEPYVLEFNVRFGDPEIQPIVLRMKSDLFEYLEACVNGRLPEMEEIEWLNDAAVCVVMASSGYPGKYEKGKVITGLDEVARIEGVVAFHAGTARVGSSIITNGGRVLAVTALAENIPQAIEKAYRAVSLIHWEGEYHRKDIGRKALRHLNAA